ncbi:hypothetical protein PR048_016230 [Dryococelus australis]|uniref:Uncharacterized protein n=1 Tax=Dryococelus australis TaxID=614101 RepID=A0ABQ9HJ65_9NEOP|nr:hypothetical protein PR048_016230 [Dryococelus australis]
MHIHAQQEDTGMLHLKSSFGSALQKADLSRFHSMSPNFIISIYSRFRGGIGVRQLSSRRIRSSRRFTGFSPNGHSLKNLKRGVGGKCFSPLLFSSVITFILTPRLQLSHSLADPDRNRRRRRQHSFSKKGGWALSCDTTDGRGARPVINEKTRGLRGFYTSATCCRATLESRTLLGRSSIQEAEKYLISPKLHVGIDISNGRSLPAASLRARIRYRKVKFHGALADRCEEDLGQRVETWIAYRNFLRISLSNSPVCRPPRGLLGVITNPLSRFLPLPALLKLFTLSWNLRILDADQKGRWRDEITKLRVFNNRTPAICRAGQGTGSSGFRLKRSQLILLKH